MEIVDEAGDGTGKGYNNWRFGMFVEDKDGDTAQYHMTMRNMNLKIEERCHDEIEEGNYCAYMTDNHAGPVYIVWWESKPWRLDVDDSEVVGGHTCK